MMANVDIAEVAALIGDPARANMLAALLGGQALTATELAYEARVTPQTASAHLAKLTRARLLAVEKQGRNRYFRLAGPAVANAFESLMVLAADAPPRRRPPGPKDAAMRAARTCYDHLAGGLGVAVTDALICRGFLTERGEDFVITAEGLKWFEKFEIDTQTLRRARRVFARRCLDWSERRPHLAGALGAAVADQLFEREWVARIRDSRGLTITDAGRRGLRRTLGIELQGV
ncbi:MAG TPA: metalloregulator ArsR/SmtB family transcription factor [Rhodospirillales bacterium]